jgi:hypothetical protein
MPSRSAAGLLVLGIGYHEMATNPWLKSVIE